MRKEEDKLMRRIEKRFSKGVVQYGLIEEGDKILVGLSLSLIHISEPTRP